jgi:hypothetical protein
MPFGPGGPGGPGFQTSPMPAPKDNTGRNVGIGVGALLVVGGIVAAVAFSGGGGKKNNDVMAPTNQALSGASSAPNSSAPASGSSSAAQAPNSSGSDTSSTSTSVDPASWDTASTDKTAFSPDALLPVTFTDDKGVVYTATNRWTDKCVNSYESARLKAMLTQYKCDNQAIGTYTDKDGRVLVDVAVLPLPDAPSAQNAFKDMQAKNAFTIEDWGIWCPKSGAGADICTSKKNTGNAQQYGYIQPDHRYLVHAVSLYVNLTADTSAQDWLKPAATSAAKQGGPQQAQ